MKQQDATKNVERKKKETKSEIAEKKVLKSLCVGKSTVISIQRNTGLKYRNINDILGRLRNRKIVVYQKPENENADADKRATTYQLAESVSAISNNFGFVNILLFF